MDNDFFYKVSPSSDEKMGAKREFFCTQLLGVFWLILGLVGGILIGIYLYHGGPDGEVTCKNLPEPKKQETTPTTRPASTTATPPPRTTTTQQATSMYSTDSTPSQNTTIFTYTIKNGWYESYFNESIQLPITPEAVLLSYMEIACTTDPDRFNNFTVTYYPSVPGFMVDAINGVSGNWAENQTYWKISNQDGALNVGVSQYVPSDRDEILFQLTQYVADPEHDA